MSVVQKFILAICPKSWRAKMIADSQAWHAVCPCGSARSIWEMGGIRSGAAGNPQRWMKCPKCGSATWHRLEKREMVAPPQASA
jgi:transposase-like protein